MSKNHERANVDSHRLHTFPVVDTISEIVLLDFHRFPGLGHGPPHEAAARVVMDVLEGVMIDPKYRHQPFGKILNQKGRVAVLWNAQEVCGVSFLNMVFVKRTRRCLLLLFHGVWLPVLSP